MRILKVDIGSEDENEEIDFFSGLNFVCGSKATDIFDMIEWTLVGDCHRTRRSRKQYENNKLMVAVDIYDEKIFRVIKEIEKHKQWFGIDVTDVDNKPFYYEVKDGFFKTIDDSFREFYYDYIFIDEKEIMRSEESLSSRNLAEMYNRILYTTTGDIYSVIMEIHREYNEAVEAEYIVDDLRTKAHNLEKIVQRLEEKCIDMSSEQYGKYLDCKKEAKILKEQADQIATRRLNAQEMAIMQETEDFCECLIERLHDVIKKKENAFVET